MPIYEYKCNDCQCIFEQIKSITDTSAPACPQCNSEKTTRQLSPVNSLCDKLKSIANKGSRFT